MRNHTSKPIRLIVPYAPGGATDNTARIFGEQLKNIVALAAIRSRREEGFKKADTIAV